MSKADNKEFLKALEKEIANQRVARAVGCFTVAAFFLLILVLVVVLWPRNTDASTLLPPKHVRAASGHLGGFSTAYVGPRNLLPKQSVVKRSYKARVTVYMSEVGQTDGDPFHTANGEHVYWGGAAMNCVPFGTKFRLPTVFGSKVFRVNDRGGMPCGDPDIWLPNNDFHGWKGTNNYLIEILK